MTKTRKRQYAKKGGGGSKLRMMGQYLTSGTAAVKAKTCKHYHAKYTKLIKKCNKEIKKINMKINEKFNKNKEKVDCIEYSKIRIPNFEDLTSEHVYMIANPFKTPEKKKELTPAPAPAQAQAQAPAQAPAPDSNRSISLYEADSQTNENYVPPPVIPPPLPIRRTTLRKTPVKTIYFNTLPFKKASSSVNTIKLNEQMRGNTNKVIRKLTGPKTPVII